MVKEIVHDTFILSMKSIDATIDDINVANDLLDTLNIINIEYLSPHHQYLNRGSS